MIQIPYKRAHEITRYAPISILEKTDPPFLSSRHLTGAAADHVY